MKQNELVKKIEQTLTSIILRHEEPDYWYRLSQSELTILGKAEEFIIKTIEKEKMDKEIKKVGKKIMSAKKETGKLMKMDKKQDKKIAMAKKVLKKKGKC